MDDWKQVAAYFYVATIVAAIIIVVGFFSYKMYNWNKYSAVGAEQYGNICVSDEEDEIKLEMPKYSDATSETDEEEEKKEEEEILVTMEESNSGSDEESNSESDEETKTI